MTEQNSNPTAQPTLKPGPATSGTLQVPVIDLASIDTELSERIFSACSEWGFFQVINHDIDTGLRQRFMTACQDFFHGPDSVKNSVRRSDKNPMGFYDQELTKNRRDWKHIFDYGADWRDPDTLQPSRFPTTRPPIEPVLRDWFSACETLSLRLISTIELALDVNPGSLINAFTPAHTSFSRLNYYPLCPRPLSGSAQETAQETDDQAPGELGIHRHTDAGALTVLVQDDVASLQVNRDGQWHTIVPEPCGLIINIGDMLQVWSNDTFIAPEHRVLASNTQERFSAAFFLNPANHVTCTPLQTAEPRYRPVHWGKFRAARAEGDYADNGEEIQIAHFRRQGTSD